MVPDLHKKALAHVAERLGGVPQLSAALDQPPEVVWLWVAGHEPVPGDVFLRVVDLLNADVVNRIKSQHPDELPTSDYALELIAAIKAMRDRT